MLPYQLRELRVGEKKGANRRRSEASKEETKDGECGGTVQRAMTKDLINLREKFRKQVLRDSDCRTESPGHQKAGTAFSMFKDIFGSSKTAVLHLIPPARCDREAYSQLIYASCLALFKESFERYSWGTTENLVDRDDDSDNCSHYDDACFAVFSLFALFETNPLPRDFKGDNPMELLPVSVRSSSDPESSHRRFFLKNIRIDRRHFALFLGLREASLAKICDCERSYYTSKRSLLHGSRHDEQGHLWRCSCAMATDSLEILDRIFPLLELSEYTGPVGAEAFAGHVEYPYSRSFLGQESACQSGKRIPESFHGPKIGGDTKRSVVSSIDYSTEIRTLIGKYKKIVAGIRIPSSKLKSVRHLRGELESLFSAISAKQRQSTRSVLVDQSVETKRHQNDSNELPGASIRTEISQAYQIILGEKIPDSLKTQLRASVMALLRRDEPIPLPSDLDDHRSKPSLERDDISSIGCGGISLAMGQGRAGIRSLFSCGGRESVPKNSYQKNEMKIITSSAFANEFLTTNEEIDSAGSSDENSIDSEISVLSYSSSEGIDDDQISMATSTFGRKALDDLLQKVAHEGDRGVRLKRKKSKALSSNKKIGERQGNNTRLSSSMTNSKYRHEYEDDDSAATSAFGKRALDTLLKTVTQERTSSLKGGVNNGKGKSQKQVSTNSSREKREQQEDTTKLRSSLNINDEDEDSIATSAFGKRALDTLLKTVTQERTSSLKGGVNNRKGKSQKANKKKRKTQDYANKLTSPIKVNQGEDEASVATSAFGKRALDKLFEKVRQEGARNPGEGVQTRKRKRQQAVSMKKKRSMEENAAKVHPFLTGRSDMNSEDELSVATSAFGKRALEELLHTTTQENSGIQKGKGNPDLETQQRIGKKKDDTSSATRKLGENDNDEISVGTSAYGEMALGDLLKVATQEDVV